MDAQELGKLGEDCAEKTLLAKGHKLLARNWSCPWGEIDMISRDGEYICFIEVKTRKIGAMVTPFEAVDFSKRKRIIRAAILYLQQNPQDLQPRFDVFAVYYDRRWGIADTDYLMGAFDLDGFEGF